MELQRIELTPEQKGLLAALSQETGQPVSALIDQLLDDLQKQVRAGRTDESEAQRSGKAAQKPIWEVFADAKDIPEEEWDKLPADLATQHDHYIYDTPKRPV